MGGWWSKQTGTTCLGDTTDVLGPVFLRESQVGVETEADVVSVKAVRDVACSKVNRNKEKKK